jgi:SpoVK/Ycf46/Vps4 family AAA+-type ATPase
VQNLIERAVKNNRRITMDYLREVKKEMIEKSASGRIVFVESTRTLDDVAAHREAKAWLRQDAQLMKKGKLKALPMGYLITGRIGTGKTYLVECFAGEAGVPCVELKNFRDKWVGATEGNLETIFKILHAMGQVIVGDGIVSRPIRNRHTRTERLARHRKKKLCRAQSKKRSSQRIVKKLCLYRNGQP